MKCEKWTVSIKFLLNMYNHEHFVETKVVNVCETVLEISRWTGNAYFSFNFTNFAPNLFIMKMDLEIIP